MLVTSTLWPALGATLAVVCFALGWRQMRGDISEHLDVGDLVLLRAERRREASGRLSPLERLAGRLVPSLRRLFGPRGVRWLQQQIDHAGRPDGLTVQVLLRQVGWWLLLLTPVLLLSLAAGNVLALPLVPLVAVIFPVSRVAAQSRKRREQLDLDLPDFLDILAVTVSAGISFRGALARVADRFDGPLAQEIRLTLDQLAHGASVRIAFEQMRDRTGSAAMEQFVRAFLQSEELGAPLVETLNQIALDMRRESAQRLRRKAATMAPRVTLVTSLVLVPAALILVVAGVVLGSGIDFGALGRGLQ
ncbi:MAG TPA: type II secretion system F family protein [Actinomycetales bacterium]|jgi:tight adherence protein C